MTRFVVERTFPGGVPIPASPEGAQGCLNVVGGNAKHEVTWVHSYIAGEKTFCIYDGPTAQSIFDAAATNGLPIDKVTPVRVLDPYFHH